MHVMRPGRFLSALVATLLGVALALPSAADLCTPAPGRCAGMPAAMKALCGRTDKAISDCCRKTQQSTPARSSSDEPSLVATPPNAMPATLPVLPVAGLLAVGPAARAFSRQAALHRLGLFTLYSVFRI